MVICKCTNKFRNKQGIIIGYELVDSKGTKQQVTARSLKNAIVNKQAHVINLKLTSDGRLIDADNNISITNNKPNSLSILKDNLYKSEFGYYLENGAKIEEQDNCFRCTIILERYILLLLAEKDKLSIDIVDIVTDDKVGNVECTDYDITTLNTADKTVFKLTDRYEKWLSDGYICELPKIIVSRGKASETPIPSNVLSIFKANKQFLDKIADEFEVDDYSYVNRFMLCANEGFAQVSLSEAIGLDMHITITIGIGASGYTLAKYYESFDRGDRYATHRMGEYLEKFEGAYDNDTYGKITDILARIKDTDEGTINKILASDLCKYNPNDDESLNDFINQLGGL